MLNKINKIHLLFSIIIIYFIFLYFQPKRHYLALPTLSFMYPSNEKEIVIVQEQIKTRTEEDILLFNNTDNHRGLINSINYIIPDIDKKDLFNDIAKLAIIPFFLKILYNRARPYVFDNTINYIHTKTNKGPSFPSGHAFCSYAIAKKYSKLYPEKKEELYNLINRITNVRVKAGVHYPSDIEYSKYFIDKYEKYLSFIFN